MLSKAFVRSFKSYAVLKPFMDFEARLCNLPSVKANVGRRGLDVNVEEIAAFYENWKNLDKVKSDLEDSREAVKGKLSTLGKNGDENEERKLKIAAKILREDHKRMKAAVGDLEQNLAGLMMKVPNELSPRTKDLEEVVHERVLPRKARGSHIEIGEALDLVEVKSPTGIFLKGAAAFFELEIVQKLSRELSQRGFVGVSNPDFVREIVSDGCSGVFGSSLPLSPFEEGDDITTLTGGAAPEPFFAFFAKNSLKISDLPVRCYATGRKYGPGTAAVGLYDPRQTDAVQIFVVTSPSSENQEVDDVVSAVKNFYDALDVSYRLTVKSSRQLRVAESLRYSFEVFSPHFDEYFELGHVSLYGDHVSKNLNIRLAGGGENEFARVISGTVLRVGPLLGGVLENEGKLKLSLCNR